MAIYSIYRITNLVNSKVYIGKTTIKPELRFKRHQNSAKHGSSQYIHRAFRKYGIESFVFEVIFQSFSNDNLDDFERHFIKEHDCCILDGATKGYNMTRGGDGIDSETATYYNLKRIADGTHYFLTEEFAEANKQRNADKVADGTHPFLGSSFNDARVLAGTHPWAGTAGSKHNSEKSKKAIAAGTHNFGSAFSTKHNNARVADGTHNLLSDESKAASSARGQALVKAGTHQFLTMASAKVISCIYCKKECSRPCFGKHHGHKCKSKT